MTLRHLTFGGAVIALAAFTLSQGAISAPATPAVRVAAVPRATVPLDKVPAAALAKLRVENSAGQIVGTVVDVVTRSDGKAVSLTVDTAPMNGGKRHWVGIDARKMGLDQGRGVLVASLTAAEIKALPSLL